MNRQLGSKMNKDVFRFQYLERGTKRKNWIQHLSYTINSHEAFDTADPCSSRDCVIYELNKRLTTLTVSLVIERLSLAWLEDLTHELSNFYFLTLRDSLELRMIET